MVSYISMSQIIFDYFYFQVGQGSTEANRELLRKRLFRNKRKLRLRGVSNLYKIQMAEIVLFIEQYASTMQISTIKLHLQSLSSHKTYSPKNV